MRRVLIISLGFIGVMIALLLAAAVFVFYTPPGRTMLVNIAENAIGEQLNSTAQIGALKGAPPGHIILTDIALSDDEGVWFTTERLDLRWRPLALLSGDILVSTVNIDQPSLLRPPPQTSQDDDSARQITLPTDLPRIKVNAFRIVNLSAQITGVRQVLNGAGAVRLDGTDLALALTLSSDGGLDTADVNFEKIPSRDKFYINASLDAREGGVLTTLLGVAGPLTVAATGDSPVAQAEMTLTGQVGEYGAFNASVLSNFDRFDGADLDVTLTAGTRLNTIEELTAPVTLSARYDVKNRGGALTIQSLTSAIGDIDGEIAWRAPRGVVDQLSTKLNIVVAQNYRMDLQPLIGDTLSLEATLDWRRDDYGLTGALTTPRASVSIANGATDLRSVLTGDIVMRLDDNTSTPVLGTGIDATAMLDADFDKRILLNGVAITTGDGSTLKGQGEYSIADEAADFNADIVITKTLIAALAPSINANGDIAGDIAISGPADRFTLIANAETPSLQFNDGTMPALQVTTSLAGLPRLPSGDILATAIDDGPRRLEAQLRASREGVIRLPKLSYAGKNFQLAGAGAIDPARQTIEIDMTYRGDRDAAPWPGVQAIGDLTVKGVASRDGALNDITAKAGNLTINSIAASGAELIAQGPPGAINLSLKTNVLKAPAIGPVRSLTAEAQINAGAAPTATLTALNAIISDNNTRLTTPAVFSLSNGVAIENFRLAYGGAGSIAVDGRYGPQRWVADAVLENINIPNADGQISLTLKLDTDLVTPAVAAFNLKSLLLDETQTSISGRAIWNGAAINITDTETSDAIDMDISLPIQLVKTPALAIGTDGEMNGYVRYDGDVQTVSAYLPPTLQTLEGLLSADFTVSGPYAAPALSGKAILTEGAYTESQSGFSLAGVHAEAQADYAGAQSIVTFTGGARGADQTGDDTMTFDGDFTVGDDARLDFELTLDNAELSAQPVDLVRANGALTVRGPFDALIARGDITIDELDAAIITPDSNGLVDIEVLAYNDENITPEILAEQKDPGLDFSIRISADDRVFIRGRGLESEWSADVTAVDGREAPLILGDMNLRRGWLDFSGRRFELTRGAIAFDRLEANNPRLDIRAEYETSDGVTAAIIVSGRALEPQIDLRSTPSSPPEDVMALILFGKDAQDLSPFESLQAAEALASLSGVGPFGGEGFTGRLRRTVGLDLLNFDLDPENGGGSLTVGKYVADGFFVSASQDAQGGSGAVRVKYEITDNVTVETELEQTGDQTVSANWKKDF